MEKRLQEFKDNYLESLLQFLWRQWSSLGIAGYAETQGTWVIDPEALLIFSCSIGRYDQRLFDEMLDWLSVNERFINIQRLRTIIMKEQFQTEAALGAIAAYLSHQNFTPKWKRLAEGGKNENKIPEDFFFLKSGAPLPVPKGRDEIFESYGLIRNPVENRGLSNAFPAKTIPSFLLQLRALMGVSARCEVLLYLLLHDKATIQEIAGQTYYSWRSVQDTLFEISRSGMLNFPDAKRGRTYRLHEEPWLNMLLKNPESKIKWLCWPPLFRALELVWQKLNDSSFVGLSPLGQGSELRLLMNEHVSAKLEQAGLGSLVQSPRHYEGEEYIEVFWNTMNAILNALDSGMVKSSPTQKGGAMPEDLPTPDKSIGQVKRRHKKLEGK